MSLLLLCLLVQDPPPLAPGEKFVVQLPADPAVTVSLLGVAPGGSAAAWREFKSGSFSVAWNGGRIDGLDKVEPYCAWKESLTPVFKVIKAGRVHILLGDQLSEPYESVSDPLLSPSRKSVAYVAREKSKVLVVDSGKRWDVGNVLEHTLAFSPEDELFYVASIKTTSGMGTYAWLGGNTKELKAYLNGANAGPVAFSADGVIAYPLLAGGTVQTTAGFTGPGGFDRASGLRFSADGKVIAYFGELRESGKSKKLLVLNGVVGPTKYDDVAGFPGLSYDGKVAAYIAKKGSKWVVAQDTKFSDAFDVIRPRIGDVDQPVISLDGRSIAFVAERAGKSVLVVNNRVMAEEAFLSAPVLNSAGSTVTYGFASKQNVIWKTVAIPGR